MLLSKVYQYRTAKRVNANLALIVVILPNMHTSLSIDQLLIDFQPAISSGLLRLVEVTLTEDEAAELLTAEETA